MISASTIERYPQLKLDRSTNKKPALSTPTGTG